MKKEENSCSVIPEPETFFMHFPLTDDFISGLIAFFCFCFQPNHTNMNCPAVIRRILQKIFIDECLNESRSGMLR